MQILGLDPGDATGYGRIELVEREIALLDYGTIPVLRHHKIETRAWLHDYLKTHGEIHVIAYENAAFGTLYPKVTATIQIQGIIELVREEFDLPCHNYAPKSVKAAIGAGNYTKAQIRKILERQLNLAKINNNHASDAIAVACCAALREYRATWPYQVMQEPQLPFSQVPQKVRRKRPQIKDMTDVQIEEAIRTGRAEFDAQGHVVGVK